MTFVVKLLILVGLANESAKRQVKMLDWELTLSELVEKEKVL